MKYKAMCVAVSMAVLAESALAQSVLEEVTVTARKRTETLQEVPVAVTAFTASQLDSFDVQSVMDLSARVPNFQAPRNTVSFAAPQFYMRGAGRAENNWNFENAVAVFVDGVYLQSTAGAYIDMLDIESVEVLRGPQGTLYGRNATTGAISFTTRAPELEQTRILAEATLGSNERRDIKFTYSTPIIENELGVKVDLFRTENSGYATLVSVDGATLDDEVASQEHIGGRLGFLWSASDAVDLQLILEASEQDNGTNLITPIIPTDFSQYVSKSGSSTWIPQYGPNVGAFEPLTGNGGSDFDGFNAVFKATVDLSFATLTSITGWREYSDTYSSQLSGQGTPVPFGPGINAWSHVDSDNDFEQFTQEFQLAGDLTDRLDYVAGIYYFQNDWTQRQYVGALLPIEFSPVCCFPGQSERFGGAWDDTAQDSESVAIYFDATYQMTDSVSVFFGGRQTWDEKSVDYLAYFEDGVTVIPGFPVNPSEDWSEFTPRVGVDWQLNDDVLLYVSYARGFKSGALEGARATDPVFASTWLAPEIVDTYEFGLKADWFSSRLRTNLAVFTSEYSDKVDLITPQAAAVADVDIDGIELDVSWIPVDSVTVWGNVGYLDAKYTSADSDHPIFDDVGIPGNAPGLGAEPVVTPEYTFAVGANYFLPLGNGGGLSFQLDYSGVADHYSGLGVGNFDSEIVEAYELLGANVTYTSPDERWSLSLGGDNLTDEEYWTTTMFGFIPGRTYGDEATWYLRLRYQTP
jgi:iron complex outermembrane receptor protein